MQGQEPHTTGEGAGSAALQGHVAATPASPIVLTYTANFSQDDGWTLNAYDQNGGFVSYAVLPDPVAATTLTGLGFWQIVVQDGVHYCFSGGAPADTIVCADYMTANAIDESAPATAPGAPGTTALLPGMNPPGGLGCICS